jgi:putative ABC transport system permease protein
MGSLLQDLRYSLRTLGKARGLTIVAVLTLGLAIGANTAMFSVVNGVLLRPERYHDPDRLVLMFEEVPAIGRLTVSYQNYKDFRDQSHSYDQIAAVRNATMTLTGAGDPERLQVENVTATLFDTLGISPETGRKFTAEEDGAGGPAVAMISHGLWQRRFGGELSVLGRAITLDNKSYTIIGVVPAGYEFFHQAPDVLFPFEPWARTLPDDRAWHPGIVPVARLKPGVSVMQADSEMKLIAKRLEQQYPIFDTGMSAGAIRVHDQMVQNVRPALLVLMAAVGFVLLIACTNVANLLLARAAQRQREIAVRAAIGANRLRIVRQLLTESVVLALCAAAAGAVMATVAMPPLLHLAGSGLPGSNRVSLDLWVLGFTALIGVAAGILFGLAPARHAWRLSVRDALNETDRGAVGRGHARLRSTLVITEVALAMLLLIGSGLLLRSFERLSNVSPGFSTDHILIAEIPVSRQAYPSAAERLNFFDRVLERAQTLPGVQSAGAASVLPVTGPGSSLYFNIQGRPPKKIGEYSLANYRVVSAGYQQVLRIPLLQGRWITEADREGAPPVVVINARMARTFFPNESPLGHYLQVGGTPDKDTPWMQVVGVVGDVKEALGTDASAEYYVPFRQADKVLPVFALAMVLRTAGDPLTLAGAFRNAVHEINPDQPVLRIRTMEDSVADSVSQPRFRTVLLAIFAGVALALAAIGIFSVMAYAVTQRTRELGVRMALGASRERILALVLGNGALLTIIGVLVGLGASLLLTRYLAALLFGVGRFDMVTLVIMAVLVVMVSLAACYVPARRATKVDPMIALRYE